MYKSTQGISSKKQRKVFPQNIYKRSVTNIYINTEVTKHLNAEALPISMQWWTKHLNAEARSVTNHKASKTQTYYYRLLAAPGSAPGHNTRAELQYKYNTYIIKRQSNRIAIC